MEDNSLSAKRTYSERLSSGSTPTEKLPKRLEEDIGRCENWKDTGDLDNQDEVLRALTMAGEVGTKLDEILRRLEKLDTIEAKLNDVSGRLAKVESVVAKLQADARARDDNIEQMDNGLKYMNEEVEELRSKLEGKDKHIENLHTKHLYLESYSRRENLKFFGVPEREVSASENGEVIDTRKVLDEFMETTLGIKDPRNSIEIQRVHRVGKSVNGKPRPILARFLRFPDRERVLRAAYNLRETNYMVLQDFPREIIERRRKQMPKLKEAKKKGQKVSFSKAEPDKLYINGKFIPM